MYLDEWRRPWNLLIAKHESPKLGKIESPNPNIKFVYWLPDWGDKNYYTFQEIDSDLLIAIDKNDVPSVKTALMQDKIDVNNLYMMPFYELDETVTPCLSTFLQRALWKRSDKVFDFLLHNGANPKIRTAGNSNTLHDLFTYLTKEDILKFGKMLIDTGVTPEEINRASFGDEQSCVQELVNYANSKPKLVQKQKNKRVLKNLGRIKE